MKTRKELYEYWRNPEEKNSPKMYINHPERTNYLVGLIAKYTDTGCSILEIGSNVGRNLNGLSNAGYIDLNGVEINHDAVSLFYKIYPGTHATLYEMPIEDFVDIKHYPYDVIFSMCALMHIHPDSNSVFEEIAKRTRKHIITIEDEVKETWRHCPRNYKDVFEPFGFEQVFTEIVPWGENGCVTRVLKRVGD